MGDPLQIAVLGDVHGHLTLAYRLLKRWQRETGRAIDLILQVGDLGAFPAPFSVDRATLRFAQRDPDELGFVHYYEGSPEADAILGPDAPDETRIDADLYFVKGNHEDFEYLESLGATSGPVPVDGYGKILYLASGLVHTICVRGQRLKVAALGGKALRGGPSVGPASPFYTSAEVRSLRAAETPWDILLTHDAPFGAVFEEAGSQDILELVAEFQPRFHFCGHYHEPGRALGVPGATQSFNLNEVNFRTARELNPGCIGVLTWSNPHPCRFELLEGAWLEEYTRFNYRSR